MTTENLSALKIHKLTQAQYERELAAGRIDETALYLTEDDSDSTYATKSELEELITKHDIEANWNTKVDFIPKKGEFILYDIDENYSYERIKVGDGITPVTNLPFYLASEINSIQQKLQVLDEYALDVEVDRNLNILVFTKPLSL